jgi:hypothetical protein
VSVPDFVRRQIRQQLWTIAEELGWMSLPTTEKRRRYEEWTHDVRFGGLLSKYIDKGQVRVYLKDTIMKEFTRTASANAVLPLRLLKLPDDTRVSRKYIKPHGTRLADGRLIAWGRAGDWKLILMALHERATREPDRPYAAILMNATGRFAESNTRAMVEDAARKLRIEKLLWA